MPSGVQRLGGQQQAVNPEGQKREVPETASERMRRGAVELSRLQALERVRAGDEADDEGPMLGAVLAHERHMKQGSYRRLEAALEQLRSGDMIAWWVLTRTFVEPLPTRRHEREVSVAIATLNQLLVPPIRVPGDERGRMDPTERDALIRYLAADAWSGARIARRVGTSEMTVSRAVRQPQRCGWVVFLGGSRVDVCGQLATGEHRGMHVCRRHLEASSSGLPPAVFPQAA